MFRFRNKMFDVKLKQNGSNFPQIIAIISASLAAISNGLLFSWTSPSIPELLEGNSTSISFEEASYFTVITPISMALSAPLFALLMDAIGRKNAVLSIAIPQLSAWILTGLANSVWLFYLARFLSGIGDAAFYAAGPIYVGEISQPKVRGTWGNLLGISVYLGIFLINVIGTFNDIPRTALICGCLPLIHLVTFCFVPESPYYLLMKGREEEAKRSLRSLNWKIDVDEEFESLKADVARQISEPGKIKDLFAIGSNRRALIMCVGMRIAQQFSGLPAFEMHTQYMFQQAGGDVSHQVSAITIAGMLALCVGLSGFIVEKFGRRPLMIFSSFGCAIILTIETAYFAIAQFTNFDVSALGWLPLVGMVCYTIVCSSGLGILPTLVSGEIFSASIKAKATSVMNIALAGCVITVPKLFQSLTHSFGIFAPFCFFSVCCLLSGVFSCFFVIETKGKTLEDIQQELKSDKSIKSIT